MEELLFEENEKVCLNAYTMPNTLLYIDYSLIDVYMRHNPVLTEFFQKQEEVKVEDGEETKVEDEREGDIKVKRQVTANFNFDSDGQEEDEFDPIDRPRAVSQNLGASSQQLDQTFGNNDKHRKATLSQKISYTTEELVKKVEYFIPIEQRIFKAKSSAIDITLANTVWTALRNHADNGEVKLKSVSKSNSFSFEELIQFENEIENRRSSSKKMNNPLVHNLPLYSFKTLETLELAQQEGE